MVIFGLMLRDFSNTKMVNGLSMQLNWIKVLDKNFNRHQRAIEHLNIW